jgi:predicted flap endonuclease-1-like 5' DNA nuclease
MTTLGQYNLVIIAIAALIGIVVAFWIFRGRKGGQKVRLSDTAPAPALGRDQGASRRVTQDGAEGNAVTDEFAAAARDVAGEIFGVDAHPQFADASGPPDALQTMKGVGPKLAAQLNAAGITRFDQLARLTPNEIAMLDERMGAFRGRIERDRMVEQAAYLSRGDTDGFEATFGRLGGA